MNNSFDNRQFQQQQQHQQQHQQHQMMNQNQFQNQLSNAVLRSSVGPNPGMMSSFGGNQDQPQMVMVVPQSQATGVRSVFNETIIQLPSCYFANNFFSKLAISEAEAL